MKEINIESREELDQILEEADGKDKLVVVDFWASWCGPCKMIAPEIRRLSEEFSEKVIFVMVDVDEAYDLAQEVGIECMPTILFYKNKEMIEELKGANKALLREKLETHV